MDITVIRRQSDASAFFKNYYLLLAAAGGGVCLYLITLSLSPAADGGLCEVLGGSCQEIVQSGGYRVFGFSPAALGFGYYLFLFSYAVLVRSIENGSDPTVLLPLLLTGSFGVSASGYYLYQLFFVLEQHCLAC